MCLKSRPRRLIVSPAVPGGAHRRQQGGGRGAAAIVLALIVLGILGGGAWFLFLRDGGIQLGEPERPVPEFSFEFIKVWGTSVEGRVPEENLAVPAEEVRETLDALYMAGFVDPSKWQGGTFPEVLELFGGRAAKGASRDLDDLTLGADATRIEYVDPFNGRLSIRFLLDGGEEPLAAVARTVFGANAKSTAGGDVAVQHAGTYFMLPDGDRWLIGAYQTNGIVTPVHIPLSPDAEASP